METLVMLFIVFMN